jgi:tRNA-2-methylthio-N6-dimethylallyladenosine synthase
VAKGYRLARSEATADVILLNTCSVRDAAEQKAMNKMRNLIAETRRHRPHVVLGIMGCMAQSKGPQLIDKLPDLDLVLGTQKFHRTAEYLEAILAGEREQICDVESERGSEGRIREHILNGSGKDKAVSAFVSIMQGCNQHCTFCIVPFTRGEERSRAIPDIVGECAELVERGAKEVTLLGQIVTSYGKRDLAPQNGRSGFVQLLDAVHEIEGLHRIRFTSPHPKGYGEDLVEAYGRLPKLCESAHLPVQSGSDRILKLMHRGYTRERFLALVERLRTVRPNIALTTDIIVGFPGETEEAFAETLALVEKVRFDNAFMFKYSPRQGTPAASLPEQIPQPVIEERHARLLAVVNQIATDKLQRLIGERVEVLVEGPSRKNPLRLEGRTRANQIVVFEGTPHHRGALLNLKIERSSAFTLYAEPAADILDERSALQQLVQSPGTAAPGRDAA